jgi:hypothetical protein
MRKFVCIVALFLFVAGVSAESIRGKVCSGGDSIQFYADGDVVVYSGGQRVEGTYSGGGTAFKIALNNGETIRATLVKSRDGSSFTVTLDNGAKFSKDNCN